MAYYFDKSSNKSCALIISLKSSYQTAIPLVITGITVPQVVLLTPLKFELRLA